AKSISSRCHRSLWLCSLWKPRHVAPRGKGPRAERAIMASKQEMAAEAKEIIGWAMDRQEPLCLPRGFEAAHLSFLLPGRLMGDSRRFVLPAPLAVSHTGQHPPARCPRAPKLIGHQFGGDILNPFKQLAKEAFRSVFVPPFLYQDIEHLA